MAAVADLVIKSGLYRLDGPYHEPYLAKENRFLSFKTPIDPTGPVAKTHPSQP
jgi:hypothetical protein